MVESRKSQNFLNPAYFEHPLSGSPWNCVLTQGVKKTRMMGLPDGQVLR